MNLIYDHYFTEVDEPSADIDLLLQEVILENYNIHTSHIKIFIILIKLIFQNNIFNKICGIFLIFFGDMATFAVEVWSWKLCQIKDPLAFGAAFRGSVNQNIVLRRIIKTTRRRAR